MFTHLTGQEVKPKIIWRLKLRKVYDKEFKLNAIRLSEESGMTVRDLEKELGIGSGGISHWKKELQEDSANAFPGNGNPKDKEIYELKKKVADLELESEILKKAIAIFSGRKK
jgi:transposase